MDTRYSNPGKILRARFPDQTLTQGAILVWTVVYLLNLAAARSSSRCCFGRWSPSVWKR